MVFRRLANKVRNLFFRDFKGGSRNRGKIKVKSKGSLLHFFSLSISLYLSIYLYLSLYIFHSLYLYLYLFLLISLSCGIKKIIVPKSLLEIRGDRGPIKTVNLAVGEDVAEILWAAVGHTHIFDANWGLVFVFKPP